MSTVSLLDFVIGLSEDKNVLPNEFFKATVPGAAQLDYAKHKGWGDYWFSENYKDYSFLEDVYWFYKANVVIENFADTPYLDIKGIDYKFDILINDKAILSQEGMYTPIMLDLSEYKGTEISITVIVYPSPKDRTGKKDTSREARRCCKPPVSYGWDWHPRLIPAGIYTQACITYKSPAHFTKKNISMYLSDDLKSGFVYAQTEVSVPSKVYFSLKDEKGNIVAKTEAFVEKNGELELAVSSPELWWCVSHGKQTLYTAELAIYDGDSVCDSCTKKIGFRRVRLVENVPYGKTKDFPKTQEPFPITIELNGRRIFAKGSNFVSPEIFPGIVDRDTYKPLVEKAVNCNMNIFRMWGGSGIQKEEFYELCDEAGVMVWQEFPLACNKYPDDIHYLNVLDREAESVILKLRSHPCITIWCGGNELFNDWSGMTIQDHPLRLLDKKCFELDKFTPFMFTSPLYGMGHGHYVLRDEDGSEIIENFINAKATAYTEFGCPGPAPIDYIKKMMTEEEYENMDNSRSWKSHHAFSAWIYSDTWFRISDIKYFYGRNQTKEELLENGAELQSQYYKHIFEEGRRQWPHCSMTINWCYNEPWPCAANNSVLSWPTIEKPHYFTIKDSLRDTCFSLRVHKLGYQPNEAITAELFLLNHSMKKIQQTDYTIGIRYADGSEQIVCNGNVEKVNAMKSAYIIGVKATVKETKPSKITLFVRSDSNPSLNSEYYLYILRKKSDKQETKERRY